MSVTEQNVSPWVIVGTGLCMYTDAHYQVVSPTGDIVLEELTSEQAQAVALDCKKMCIYTNEDYQAFIFCL